MRKILFALVAFSLSISAFAQLNAPNQIDTLWITGVEYNYDTVKPGNWPFQYIVKSPSSFVFGAESFTILEVSNPLNVVFKLQGKEGVSELTFKKDKDEETCLIWFSGYRFDCSYSNPLPKAEQSADSTTLFSNCSLEPEKIDETVSARFPDQNLFFKDGDPNGFSKWVNAHLRYPANAKRNGVQGRVMVQFTIETDGSLSNVKVLRGVEPSLDKEAIRVISSSPKWTPAKRKDEPVPMTYTFPVIFQLR